jgi:hypothetical protein
MAGFFLGDMSQRGKWCFFGAISSQTIENVIEKSIPQIAARALAVVSFELRVEP